MDRQGIEVCNVTVWHSKYGYEYEMEEALMDWTRQLKDEGRRVALVRQTSSHTGVYLLVELFENQDEIETLSEKTSQPQKKQMLAATRKYTESHRYDRGKVIRASSIIRESRNTKINYYVFQVKGDPKQFLDTAEIVSEYLEKIGWQFYWIEETSGILGTFNLIVSTDSQITHDQNYVTALTNPAFSLHWYRLFDLSFTNPIHNRARSLMKISE